MRQKLLSKMLVLVAVPLIAFGQTSSDEGFYDDTETIQSTEADLAKVDNDAYKKYYNSGGNLYSTNGLRALPYIYSSRGKGGIYPGVGKIEDDTRQMFNSNVTVTAIADEGQAFIQGKKYELSKSIKFVMHKGYEVNVVVPVGVGTAKKVWGDTALIFISQTWSQIKNGARIEEFRDIKPLRNPRVIKDVTPLTVKVLTRVDDNVAVYPYDNAILAGGQDLGIIQGDLFFGYYVNKKGVVDKEPALRGVVTMVAENSSTFVVQSVMKAPKKSKFILKRYSRLTFGN